MTADELVSGVASLIRDQIGDRLYHAGDPELPQAKQWTQTAPDTVEFLFVTGERVRVTATIPQ